MENDLQQRERWPQFVRHILVAAKCTRGTIVARYADESSVPIEDISEFVSEQRQEICEGAKLRRPRERVDPVAEVRASTNLSYWPPSEWEA